MADIKVSGYMKYKDKAGNMYSMMPITTADNVEGLDELIEEAKTAGIFWATYGTTTHAEIVAACNAGKLVTLKKGTKIYQLVYLMTRSEWAYFSSVIPETTTAGLGTYGEDEESYGKTFVEGVFLTPTGWTDVIKQRLEPAPHASEHASSGKDPITPADIGAATMTEVNAAIQSAIQNTWEASY